MQNPEPKLPRRNPDEDLLYPPVPVPIPDEPGPDVVPQKETEIPQPEKLR